MHAASKPHEVELRKHLVTADFTSLQGEAHGFLLCLKLLYCIHFLAAEACLQQTVFVVGKWG